MKETVQSSLIGMFNYNVEINKYEHNEGNIRWTIDYLNVDEITY